MGSQQEREKGEEVINKYLAQLSKEELVELFQIFKDDLEAFGYAAPDIVPEK